MIIQHGTHNDLHAEAGSAPRRAPGEAPEPDHQGPGPRLAGVREARPDRVRTFRARVRPRTVSRTADELQLRGTDTGAPCRDRPPRPEVDYLGAAFRAADATDVLRLADATGAMAESSRRAWAASPST